MLSCAQLEKMFFLFPDPHFKEKNHRRRIIRYRSRFISVPVLRNSSLNGSGLSRTNPLFCHWFVWTHFVVTPNSSTAGIMLAVSLLAVEMWTTCSQALLAEYAYVMAVGGTCGPAL